MSEGLFTGLALAIISALTYVAYRHHEDYPRLALPILFIGSAINFVVLGAWLGGWYVSRALTEFIPVANREAARKALDAALPDLTTIGVWLFFSMAYVSFLVFLPAILRLDKKAP